MFDLPINATALGYYVNDIETMRTEPAAFQNYIRNVKAVAPKHLPIMDWETGSVAGWLAGWGRSATTLGLNWAGA